MIDRHRQALANLAGSAVQALHIGDRGAHVGNQFTHRVAAVAQGLAPDQVAGLNAGRAFVDRGDARIAEELRGTGFFDEAHATVHLHADRGQLHSGLGAPGFHDRGEQIATPFGTRATPRIGMQFGGVVLNGAHIGHRAHRLDLTLHAHQHAFDVGVLDDGRARAGARCLPLHALTGMLQGLLIGALGDRHAFAANRVTRGIHHRKHVHETLIGLTHQITDRTAVVAIGHHRRRAAVDAELVLNGHTTQIVARAERAIIIDQELRHREQRDAARTFGRIGQAREHQMHDVVGHVVLTIGDEDLLTADEIVRALRHGARAHGAEIGTGLRLGEVHGASPGAGDELGEKGRAQMVVAMLLDGFDRAAGQHRTQAKRQVRAVPHLADCGRHYLGQTLTTELGVHGETVPAAVAEGLIGFTPTGRGVHHIAVELAADRVTDTIER